MIIIEYEELLDVLKQSTFDSGNEDCYRCPAPMEYIDRETFLDLIQEYSDEN